VALRALLGQVSNKAFEIEVLINMITNVRPDLFLFIDRQRRLWEYHGAYEWLDKMAGWYLKKNCNI